MSQYVEISDNNYSGQTAQVTFNALEGGTYDLGEQVVPFTFYGDSISPGFSVYGEYVLYYIRFYKTCSITVLPVTTTTTIPITTTTTTIPYTTTTTTIIPLETILEVNINPGSIIIDYNFIANQHVTEELQINFTHNLGTNTGSPITIITGVTIPIGEISGTTQIVLNDSFGNLSRNDSFGDITTSPLSLNWVIYENYPTPTPTPTQTPTITPTISLTPSFTPTITVTNTPTITPTVSITPTITVTPSITLTPSITPTITPTITLTPSITPTITPTPSITPTITPTPSFTPTPSPSFIPTIEFIGIWRTTIGNEPVTLPYESTGTYDGIINWGDGNTSVNSYANRNHTYSAPGDYTITISGNCVGFRFNNAGYPTKIKEIIQWGNKFRLGNNGDYFYGCSNLVLTGVTDVLNLQGTTNLTNMFRACSQITTINRLNEWNVSGVTNMSGMFYTNQLFNQDISGWDVSNVVNMDSMFNFASSFNQPLNSWNVSGVTNMKDMFYYTSSFNQNIGSWDVSNVTNMLRMFFSNTSFNQNIGNWDVSQVTNMGFMFYNTPFNQDISGWNVLNVTDMSGMFMNASSFNQDLSSWCVTLIPSTPINFDFNATSWVLPKPGWGTCP